MGRFYFSGVRDGLNAKDFGLVVLQWSIARAERLVEAVGMIEGSPEMTGRFSLCRSVASRPREARDLFLALFIATYTTYLRVALKIPREVLADFKGSIGDHFQSAISDGASHPTTETLKMLSLLIAGFSIALEEDIFEAKDVDPNVINVQGQLATNLLIDTLKRTHASTNSSPPVAAFDSIELLQLQNLLDDEPLNLMIGLKQTAELRFALPS